MSQEPASPGGFQEFLKLLGRAMGHMSLYGVKHPSVGEAVANAHIKLEAVFGCLNSDEATLAIEQDSVLVNGAVAARTERVPNALLNMFKRLSLSSVTFRRGITKEDLAVFCELSFLKTSKNAKEEAQNFLLGRNVRGISLNEAVYTKLGKDFQPGTGGPGGGSGGGLAGTCGGGGSGAGGGSGGETAGAEQAAQSVERRFTGRTLDESIAILVKEMHLPLNEQSRVINLVLEQFRTEMESRVKEATEHIKQEKEQVEQEHARTQKVISSGADGLVIVDEAGKILMMNPAAETIFGKKLTEVAGKPIGEIAGAGKGVLTMAQPAAADRQDAVTVNGEAAMAHTIRQSAAVIKNAGGKIIGAASIPTDVAKLNEVEKLQQEFVANVTHELRSPLTSITAALDILSQNAKGRLNSDESKFLDTAARNAVRLNALINDILDFSKLQSGKLTVHAAEENPGAIAEEAVDAMRAWAKSKSIALELQKKGAAPAVLADRARTVQVLINLISNAIKFTPKDGRIEIIVDNSPEGDFVVFSVKDNGAGIAKSDQARIFERFAQLASGEKAGGTGLGLPIAKALAVLQNGRLELESEPGKGSIFKVYLPVYSGSAYYGSDAAVPDKPKPAKKWWRRLLRI